MLLPISIVQAPRIPYLSGRQAGFRRDNLWAIAFSAVLLSGPGSDEMIMSGPRRGETDPKASTPTLTRWTFLSITWTSAVGYRISKSIWYTRVCCFSLYIIKLHSEFNNLANLHKLILWQSPPCAYSTAPSGPMGCNPKMQLILKTALQHKRISCTKSCKVATQETRNLPSSHQLYYVGVGRRRRGKRTQQAAN